MKLFPSALVALLGLCCACFGATPTVHILQPYNNASVDWPFTLQATCTVSGTISGWDVYIDGNPTPYYSNKANSSTLDILVQTSVASHNIQAKCWQGSDDGYANITVDVVGGGDIPMPPSTANQYLNLDDLPVSDWQYCDTSNCSEYPPTSFTNPLGTTSSPSLDGNALYEYATGNDNPKGDDYWGILWYHHIGQQNSYSNFEVQWSFYVNSGASPQALEFDFPVWSGGRNFYFGTQCNILGSSKVWQYWNVNSGWTNTSVACSLTTGAWHTIKWYGTVNRNNNTYVYSAMQIDNAQYNIDQTIDAPTTTDGDNFTVQFQLDGNSSGSGYTEYVDEVSAWTW